MRIGFDSTQKVHTNCKSSSYLDLKLSDFLDCAAGTARSSAIATAEASRFDCLRETELATVPSFAMG